MERTNLEWDNYIEYLIQIIDESKFMKRAEIKPMTTPKTDEESHLTSRAAHVRQAANIGKRIANGLNLNGNYIYIGMLMHDAGHPFSAHEGEVIFGVIGQLYNCGFFHHNAKGVEVIRSEAICDKAIDKICNTDNNPQLRERLQQEFDYFLDIIISHDGEATRKERNKTEKQYDSIHEAVKTKLTLSNSYNDYKFIAQTPEGKLGKLADVIAYSATDIRDAFRMEIIKNFDDDYLELFGEMFTNDDTLNRKDKILYAKEMLKEIKEEKLRELKSDMNNPENKNILRLCK